MIFLLVAGASAVAQAPAPAVPAAVVPTAVVPAKPDPANPDATRPDPAKAEPAKPEPAKPDPAKPEPAKPDPAKPDPAKPDPAKPDPAKPDPAKPDPAKPDASSKPAADAPDGAGTVVTVSADRPTNRIDRQVYELKNDVAQSNNSAADALSNVPSVTVDPDGTVTLRGSTNVQILIDGKPSAMLQGEGRGAALNALPSHDIESIEVINNPGAQFGNEGGGGPILNLVMRRNRTAGGLGVLNANAGPHGRANSALSGSYHEGIVGFQGSVNFRRDGRNSYGHTERDQVDPLSGLHRLSSQQAQSTGLNDAKGANGSLSFNVGEKTVLGAQLSYTQRSNNNHGLDSYHSTGGAPLPFGDYQRSTDRSGTVNNGSWGLRMDTKGDTPGEIFKLDLRVSSQDSTGNFAYTNTYPNALTPTPDRRTRQNTRTGTDIADFTGDYERPVDQGLVKAGFKIADSTNSYDTHYVDIDPLTGKEVINLGRTNQFKVDEMNLAVYGSYQRRLNDKWGVLGGMRVEHTGLDVHQISSGVEATNSYINYIPSMFVSYGVSDATTIRFSYAHRIRRPNGNDLNPFVVYRDEFNVSAGNPKLHPSQSDSVELGVETKFGPIDTNVRAYYRKEKDVIAERSYFISDTVLLTTRDNSGTNHAGGLEFSMSGKVSPTLTINTSGNLAQTELRTIDSAGVVAMRSSNSLSLRARINYQFTPQDSLQLSGNTQGKTLTGQGYRSPNATANLSYRHTLTPQLNLVLNVTDVFDSNKNQTTIDRALLKETSIRRYDGRLIYIGLSYRFGGLAGANRQPGSRGEGGRNNPGLGARRQGERSGQDPAAQPTGQ